MQADECSIDGEREVGPGRTRSGLTLAICLLGAWLCVAVSATGDGALQSYARPAGFLVSFRITQGANGTNDQLTVIFSTRTAEGTAPPRPFFDVDILEEFSFSGRDFQKSKDQKTAELQFTRRVRDKSFIDAAYIRVVNYATDSWSGDRIWLTVDGEQILNGVQMSPRIGGPSTEPFTFFNPENWRRRNYWEASLPRLRPAPRAR